jgi:MOSC domain-containing protein YiiM
MAAGEGADEVWHYHIGGMLNEERALHGSGGGRLAGIAGRMARRAPMQERAAGLVTVAAGLDGDFKGAKYPRRQVTVLASEAWQAALADLGPGTLPWTVRRANLLVTGVRLPRAVGGIVKVGGVLLEVTGQTYPCRRMEEACPGLLPALARDWRGGVTARVLQGGPIRLEDRVEVLLDPPEIKPRLPG